MRLIVAALLLFAAAALTACGGAEEDPLGANLVEAETADAQETNTFELGGIDYRVVMFRQINPRVRSDRALYEGALPPDGVGVFAAFLRACNNTEEPRTPTERIDLEDAFGESYPQLQDASESPFAYDPRRLAPDECVPPPDSATSRAYPGAVLLYGIPFRELGNRPFVLEFVDPDAEAAGLRRVELDL